MLFRRRNQFSGVHLLLIFITILSLVGCNSSRVDVSGVEYEPITKNLWPVSTPEEQGLDPDEVAEEEDNVASQRHDVAALQIRIEKSHAVCHVLAGEISER